MRREKPKEGPYRAKGVAVGTAPENRPDTDESQKCCSRQSRWKKNRRGRKMAECVPGKWKKGKEVVRINEDGPDDLCDAPAEIREGVEQLDEENGAGEKGDNGGGQYPVPENGSLAVAGHSTPADRIDGVLEQSERAKERTVETPG
jgi:hypothetical protein